MEDNEIQFWAFKHCKNSDKVQYKVQYPFNKLPINNPCVNLSTIKTRNSDSNNIPYIAAYILWRALKGFDNIQLS